MIRAFHRWPGLVALLLVTVLAASGAVLSLFPAAESIGSPQVGTGTSVAELAARVRTAYPDVTQISRAPSGRVTAFWYGSDGPGSAVIDPATGSGVAPADPNAFETWLVSLHRSLFFGDSGRIAMAAGALAMLVLAGSGAVLVARRAGGWRRWLAPIKGPLSQRLHIEIARIAVPGLVLSAITALWMTAATFQLLPGAGLEPPFPTDVSGQTGMPVDKMAALEAVPATELRSLRFPFPDDPTDVFTLTTSDGTGYVDQGTGALLVWSKLSPFERLNETIYMLHTGRGAAVFGLVLGLMALGVPVLGATGAIIWFSRRNARPRIRGNRPAGRAETVILVGSETGSTWGFAATLHAALQAAGQSVHVAAMAQYAPERYTAARRILILAATYGDGAAPHSARGFVEKLAQAPVRKDLSVAVLGFGDRSFADFCGFGQQVAAVAAERGWRQLIPFATIDRQSEQSFARWGRELGAAMALDLELHHQPVRPATQALTLISRRDYGIAVQAPTAILRFALPAVPFWQRLTGKGFAQFQPGDLIGIVPEGSTLPRYYSLASGRRDGFVEIVVKRHAGGLCSSQLTSLEPGQSVSAFLRPNPSFHAQKEHKGTILIGAGTGIAPLAGIIRNNARQAPLHLFFGMRHPDSDFLFRDELENWQDDGRLHHLATAVSRGSQPYYVQDALRADSERVARLIRQGAKVMVCGGRDMARGVAEALDDILAPVGLVSSTLKAEGRYVEDVY